VADEIRAEIKGGREVAAALRELRDELPRNIVRSALRSSAERMRKVIIAFAPRRTGRLVQAISVKTGGRPGGIVNARVTINSRGARDNPSNAFYWRFLEKGWHSRAGIPHRKEFVGPAVQTELQDAGQNVVDVLGQAIAKAAARARIRS
jgi:Bacteriophage HK97-gp10, putative tail-component